MWSSDVAANESWTEGFGRFFYFGIEEDFSKIQTIEVCPV